MGLVAIQITWFLGSPQDRVDTPIIIGGSGENLVVADLFPELEVLTQAVGLLSFSHPKPQKVRLPNTLKKLRQKDYLKIEASLSYITYTRQAKTI